MTLLVASVALAASLCPWLTKESHVFWDNLNFAPCIFYVRKFGLPTIITHIFLFNVMFPSLEIGRSDYNHIYTQDYQKLSRQFKAKVQFLQTR